MIIGEKILTYKDWQGN